MPKNKDNMRYRNKQYRALFKELVKIQTIVLLDILKDNPDGLTYREIVTEFLNKLESIGSFTRMSLTLKRLIEMGYITKRKRITVNINVALTGKENRNEQNIIYYLELPGKNLLLKITEFYEIIEQARKFKENGIHETCSSTEVIT